MIIEGEFVIKFKHEEEIDFDPKTMTDYIKHLLLTGGKEVVSDFLEETKDVEVKEVGYIYINGRIP
jgi:hypothetical protein